MADNKKLVDLTGLSRLAEKLNEKSNEKMSNLETTLSTSMIIFPGTESAPKNCRKCRFSDQSDQ